jgi:hypothetical protein
MSISSIGGMNTVGALGPVEAGVAPPTAEAPVASGGGLAISRRARFAQDVQELAATDPAQAKQMVQDLAGTMRARASHAGGSAGAYYTKAADMLDKAASSGDYSGLASWRDSGGAQSEVARAYAVTRASR